MNSRAAHDTVRGMLAATHRSGGQAGLHGLPLARQFKACVGGAAALASAP
jgi:hypothetical protein